MPGTTDLIGYLATAVGTFLMLPQVIKSFKTKNMKDISRGMIFMYIGNCLLWFIYGLLINSIPLMLCNFIALIIGLLQLILKIKHK
ncbi:MAG: SemiSWEET family transporter [Candidatus Absconditicoccaceae bacterium]